ncbi:SufE family protein [Sulfurospirillum arcachonense]|uniref:SufE family protein n=1 Tax=Sulfurospirillum arcachonense TaxID=57666 RepID=UPI000469D082|nr:SufE family protein [Sulfurospirillum arcachonense]
MEETVYNYKEDFELFDDDMDKYEYIIDLGKKSVTLNEADKNETNKIKGCQSSVWFVVRKVDDKLFFDTDGDTVIVKGLAFILAQIYSNHTPQEILDFDREKLKILNLDEIISPVRQNGFTSMLNAIYARAKEEL